jgi:DNA-binding CsgD family transcriptional regulator
MLVWSWKSGNGPQQRLGPGALQTQTALDAGSGADLASFLAQLHKTLDVDVLLSTYISIIGGFVPAPAAAIYLLDPGTGRPTRLAAQGADEHLFPRFLSAYETGGRECDPVYSRVSKQLKITSSSMLPKRERWENHPFHRVLSVGALEHILEAPIVTSDKGLVGTLNFGRSGTEPRFSDDDVTLVDRIAEHVSIAISHAAEVTRLRERDGAMDGVFQALGTAVMITDSAGEIQFLNLSARHLFQECETNPALKTIVAEGLRHNLEALTDLSRVSRCLRLPPRTLNRSPYLTMNSVAVGSGRGLVATFWYQPGENPSFEYLHDLLTPQEIRVLEMLAQGLENKEIAEFMTISVDTVKSHLKRIFAKMRVASRTQLLSQVFCR